MYLQSYLLFQRYLSKRVVLEIVHHVTDGRELPGANVISLVTC